ncbi:hypothetical protein EYR40_011122 [Pleurotus pulmonarius]|nr:hypothetical protein EYR36_002893 [Pleurotus pulmonarius]KAF4587101.1 hypothetical protein EYR40_011122 [Pleurotus pulmonarius]
MENLENMSLHQILSETTEILGRLLPTPMVFESMDPSFVRSESFYSLLSRKLEYAYDASLCRLFVPFMDALEGVRFCLDMKEVGGYAPSSSSLASPPRGCQDIYNYIITYPLHSSTRHIILSPLSSAKPTPHLPHPPALTMSPSASSAEAYPHVSHDGIPALLAALEEEQQARAASSGASTPALSPEFWEAYHAFQATLLVDDGDSSASSPSPTSAASSGDAHGSPATPPSLNDDDMTPAVPGADAQCPPAVDAEQARFGTPPSMDNAQALRALLSVIGRGGAQSPRAFEYAHGHPAYPQQQPGAQFFDASRPPAYAPDGLLAQPLLDAGAGALQGYFAPPPSGYYMGNGLPPLDYYGAPVPQDFQHGYYYHFDYIPDGSGGLDLGGAPVQYAAPGFPMPPQSEQPNAHLGNAKPLSATGRPNELAGLAEGEVEGLSTKRKRPSPDWKGKKKAKEVEENVDDECGDDDDDVAPPPKKRRHAPRKGAAKPARKNRSYTLLPDGNYRCSRCGDDKIKNKGKHGQMCGKGPLCCPICGLELKSRRHDALKRHYKASRCRSAAAAAAGSRAGPTDDSSTAGIELAIACDDIEDGTHDEDDSDDEDDEDADEDVDGSWDDEDDESDVYANVAGPSSVTLEDIASPPPEKKAKKGKAAKKN